MTIDTYVEEAREANSSAGLKKALLGFGSAINLPYGGLGSATLDPATGHGVTPVCIVHLPPGYEAIFADRSAPCPVFERMKWGEGVPFSWDRAFYKNSGVEYLWEQQAPFGMAEGVAMGIRLRGGHRLVLGFDGPQTGRSEAVKRGQEAALGRLALGVVQVATNLLFPTRVGGFTRALACKDSVHVLANIENDAFMPPPEVRLTPREVECMALAARGKTAPEIAQIIGVSRNVAKNYIASAKGKLGRFKTVDAVALAQELALI